MKRFFLRILLTWVAVSGHVVWCVHSAEGSWFDGMEFEEYHPPSQQYKPHQQTAWRIPCGIIREDADENSSAVASTDVMPLSAIVDLDLSSSTIQKSLLLSKFSKDELSKLMVYDPASRTYAIPAGSLWLRMDSSTVLAPTLQVVTEDVIQSGNGELQDYSIHLRLGSDFVSMYQGRLDVEGAGGLVIKVDQGDGKNEKEVLIPILLSRSQIDFSF